MKKIALLTLTVVALGITGCKQQGGTEEQYNTEMGSNTNAPSLQRSPSATSTNSGANPSTP